MSSRRSSSTSSTNKKRKVATIRRSTTCMDMFQPHESMHACETCEPKLDPLCHNRKSKKKENEKSERSICRKHWEAQNANKHQHIALRHKQVCEYLDMPVGTLFKDECVHSKGTKEKFDQHVDVVIDVHENEKAVHNEETIETRESDSIANSVSSKSNNTVSSTSATTVKSKKDSKHSCVRREEHER